MLFRSFASFGQLAQNGLGGAFAFAARLKAGAAGAQVVSTNNAGVFVYDPNADGFDGYAAAVFLKGDAAPEAGAGVAFASFGDPVIGMDSNLTNSASRLDLAFQANVAGSGVTSANNTGLWVYSSQLFGGWHLLARKGDVPPGASGTVFDKFTSLAIRQSDGTGAGPLFTATLKIGVGVTSSHETGLWAVDSTGETHLLVLTGATDLVAPKTVRAFTALAAVPGSPAQRRSFDDANAVIYRATFTDGSQALVQVDVP